MLQCRPVVETSLSYNIYHYTLHDFNGKMVIHWSVGQLTVASLYSTIHNYHPAAGPVTVLTGSGACACATLPPLVSVYSE